MIIKSKPHRGGYKVAVPVKEEPKKVILPEVEVKEEEIEDPDDGEGEG